MVAQVSLSLVLLVGAGVLVRSLVNRLDVGAGFDVENLIVTDVQLGGWEDSERIAFFEDLVRMSAAVPGVEAASAITFPPLGGAGSRTSFWALDRPIPEPGDRLGADIRWVHHDYHEAMGIPLLAGRPLTAADDETAPLAIVVNESGARQVWPGEDAVGKLIDMPWDDTLRAVVVGVVGDVRHDGPDTEPYPMFYFDHRQFNTWNMMSIVLRTVPGADQAAVVEGVRDALGELDPGVPPYNVHAMRDLFADAMKRPWLATLALGVFALVALLLAAIGIYGVIAHATAQRTREIGIRMALGANRTGILGLVVRQGMHYVALAIAIGTAGAVALAQVLGGMVFGVSPTDPATFGAMALLLTVVGLAATWLPARRAATVDPVTTMRAE